MFFVTQLIGIALANVYASHGDNIPFGMSPPKDVSPTTSLFSILFAIVFAVLLMFILMRFKTESFLRIWFFLVVALAIGITLNALFIYILPPLSLNLLSFSFPLSSLASILISAPLGFLKIYRRNIIIHNFTELLIYPGIAVIFIPLLNLLTVIILLVLISIYDMYAVWHAGFMQKMAKYQINNLKVFSGFFVPYLGKKELAMIKSLSKSNKADLKNKKIKVNIAILGGGDVVFPIIASGVVLRSMGLASALVVTFGALAGLLFLFYISKKGKFYPAMPFISAGLFLGIALAYLFL